LAGAELFRRISDPEDPEHSLQLFSTYSGKGPLAGLLPPDVYSFNATAAGNVTTGHGGATGSLHSAFDFTFDFTPADSPGGPSPTPEPASLLLLGTGMGVAFAHRVRQAKRR
jgi:hypothetical protein